MVVPGESQAGAGWNTSLPAAAGPSAGLISPLMRSLNGKSIDRSVSKGSICIARTNMAF